MKSKKTKLIALLICIVLAIVLAVVVANINREPKKDKSGDSPKTKIELQDDEMDIIDSEDVVEEEILDGTDDATSSGSVPEQTGTKTDEAGTQTEETQQEPAGELIQPSDDETIIPSEPGEEPPSSGDDVGTENSDENLLPLQPLSN